MIGEVEVLRPLLYSSRPLMHQAVDNRKPGLPQVKAKDAHYHDLIADATWKKEPNVSSGKTERRWS